MGETIFKWLEKVITGPKSRYFWAFAIIALVAGVIVFPYIDANFLYYDRIEKRINNLQDMIELAGGSLEDNESLKAEYNSILEELETAREKALSNATNKVDTPRDRQIKFLAGAVLFYIVAVIVLFSKDRNERLSLKKFLNNLLAALLCIVIGSGVGWIYTLFPTFVTSELTATLGFVVEVVFLWLVIEQPKKKSTTGEEPETT